MKKGVLIGMLLFIALSSGALAQEVINVGVTGLIPDHGLYIALEKGYFKEAGIEVKFNPFASAAKMMAPLAAGQLHVAGGGISVGLFNAIARGMPVKIVSSRAQTLPGHNGMFWLVRSDLKDAIRTPADLKGRKVANVAPGAVTVYTMGKTMERAGLSIKDLDLVNMPFPEMVTAFANKAIDAAIISEPFASAAVVKGVAVKWLEPSEVIYNPYLELSGLFYNMDWAMKNRDQANKFMVAWIKGIREYVQAIKGGPNRDEVINILIKHTRVKDRAVYDRMQWYMINPDGYPIKESIQDQIDWYWKNGFITQKLSYEQVVDESFVDYAVKQLGRFKD